MSALAHLDPVHRYSSAGYHRLIETGALDEHTRVELLGGLLVTMSPKSREHEKAIRRLTRWLAEGLDLSRFELLVTGALSLADGFEPEPDLCVLAPGTHEPYHPATAALVIEVALTSGRRDLGLKARVYAAAGVPVYFVVDLDRRRVIEHLDPTVDGYRSVREVERLDARLPGIDPLDAGELIAYAFS